MKIEQGESFDKIISAKEKLQELERSGKFLFHGSPHILELLEPRQAQTTIDKESSEMVDHGEPAVSASPFSELAVFRSLISSKNIKNKNYASRFSYQDGSLSFVTNSETFVEARDNIGYVYVFNKEDFEQYSRMEYRSKKPVKPIEVMKVTFEDLPDNIEIK